MPFQSKDFKGKYGGGGRSASDYGLEDLDEATLTELASNPRKYGEKSGLANKILGQRRGLTSQADAYRAALEKSAYSDAGKQYGAGLGRISNYLAASGPLADSGTGLALKRQLAGQIYGAAGGQVNAGYADYLGNLLNQNRGFGYQKQLMQYQQKLNKPKPWDYLAGAAGGVAGAAF